MENQGDSDESGFDPVKEVRTSLPVAINKILDEIIQVVREQYFRNSNKESANPKRYSSKNSAKNFDVNKNSEIDLELFFRTIIRDLDSSKAFLEIYRTSSEKAQSEAMFILYEFYDKIDTKDKTPIKENIEKYLKAKVDECFAKVKKDDEKAKEAKETSEKYQPIFENFWNFIQGFNQDFSVYLTPLYGTRLQVVEAATTAKLNKEEFTRLAKSYKSRTGYWLWLILLITFVYGIFIIFISYPRLRDLAVSGGKITIESYLHWFIYISPVVFFSLFFYFALFFCIKSFRAYQHLEVINRHKAVVVVSIETVHKATNDEKLQDKMLGLAMKTIADTGHTGFYNKDGDNAKKGLDIPINVKVDNPLAGGK